MALLPAGAADGGGRSRVSFAEPNLDLGAAERRASQSSRESGSAASRQSTTRTVISGVSSKPSSPARASRASWTQAGRPRPSLVSLSSVDGGAPGRRKSVTPGSGQMVTRVQLGVKEVYIRSGWYDSGVATSIRRITQSKVASTISMLSLFVALFCRDIFVALQVPSNVELDIILTVVFFLFSLEFVCLSLTDITYLFRFFFWMDIVGTLSLVFDLSYMLGQDATEPTRVNASSNSENTIVLRAARAARLGARAGRLTRVLKLLRYVPFLYHSAEGGGDAKLSRVIQGKLNSVLSKRVAFLTLLIIVVIPFADLFSYPETEHSFGSWLELLSKDVERSFAVTSAEALALAQRRDSELQRFSDFYRELDYGPYGACYGSIEGDRFTCSSTAVPLAFEAWFGMPSRRASITEVRHGNVQASYDLSAPHVQEACASIAAICFCICSMLGFGLLMSNSISASVLTPLERMLMVIRGHCKQIFRFVDGLQDTDSAGPRASAADMEGAAYDQESEFALLEHAIAKLAAIAHLTTADKEPQVTDSMDDDYRLRMALMQRDTGYAGSRRTTRLSKTESEREVSREKRSSQIVEIRTPSASLIPEEIESSLDTDSFNVLSWSSEIRAAVAAQVIASVDNHVEDSCLLKFVAAVEAAYVPNPYHNFSHGIDVLCTVARWMRLISNVDDFLTEDFQYSLMIAAIGHDAGHFGVNNQFLVETSQDLAVKYNDSSPLEMMHCATLFRIVQRPDCNVFPTKEGHVYKEIRKGIIAAILHTDMTKHGEMIKELGLFYQLNSEAFDNLKPHEAVDSEQHVQLLKNVFLHGADVSNPMKPWEVCQSWAHLCLDEFFAQGDKEKAMGVPVQPLNDRDKVNRPSSQVGFIEFAILPLAEAIVRVFPPLDGIVNNVGGNIREWSEVWQTDFSPPESEVEKVEARVQKVEARCRALMRIHKHSSHAAHGPTLTRSATGGLYAI